MRANSVLRRYKGHALTALITGLGVSSLWFFIYDHANSPTGKAIVVPAQLAKSKMVSQERRTPPPPTTERSSEEEKMLVLGITRKREGLESGLIRELIMNPALGAIPRNPCRQKNLKRWAGCTADVMAFRAGLRDRKFGAQMCVRQHDTTSFVIQKTADGSFAIAEYHLPPGRTFAELAGSPPTHVRLLASSISHSQFLGWPGTHQTIPSYEYLCTAA